MKNILNITDIELVEDQIRTFEKNTGSDLLLIVADSCDPYPAAPWRFGFITTVIISFVFAYYIEFHHPLLWPSFFTLLLILCTWIGHFDWAKRLTLAQFEVERECSEKASELFHTLGTSQVEHQVTAMILISLLEKKIEVLVDKKLREKIEQKELDDLVKIIEQEFKRNKFAAGLIQSMKTLESKIISEFAGKVCDRTESELHDSIIFIKD